MELVSCGCDAFSVTCSKMSASTLKTLSWHHLYLPWLSAVLHLTSMCANVPLPPHNLQSGSSLIVGVGRVSFTDRSRKEMQKGSSLQSSGHMIFPILAGPTLSRLLVIQVPWPLTFALTSPGVGPRLRSCLSSALGLLSPIAGRGWFQVLVSPCKGSLWCPSTSACFLAVPLICQLASWSCGDTCTFSITEKSLCCHSLGLSHFFSYRFDAWGGIRNPRTSWIVSLFYRQNLCHHNNFIDNLNLIHIYT